MTPVERIARLVGLLDRVQKNATATRPSRGATPPVATAAVAKSSPLAAPPQAAPPQAAPPPPAPPVPAPTPAAAAPAPSPTPPPAATTPAYPSAPPGLGLDAPSNVQSSAPPPAPPPQPVLSSWPSEPVSAVQPRPSEAPEELGEDDLVDMTTLPPASSAEERGADPDLAVAVSSSEDVEISIEEEEDEEQPPASSRRAILSEESDVITETALDDEREVPAKTPPPESGPQEAALPLGGPLSEGRLPDVMQLEADMLGPPSMGPTAEQLGETIELEPPRGPELEIDIAGAAHPVPPPEAPAEELEVSLPRTPMLSGTFDVGPSIPPIDISTKAEPLPTVPVGRLIQESPTSVEIRSTSADVTVRPTHGATDVARVTLAQSPTTRVFTDILDQSLAL